MKKAKPERKDCPMRHYANGNCSPLGGFCTAVPNPICQALRQAHDSGMAYAWSKMRQEAMKRLTMEDVLKMDGQPVWLDNSPHGWLNYLIDLKSGPEPCGRDPYGRVTSLDLLVETGLYKTPVVPNVGWLEPTEK